MGAASLTTDDVEAQVYTCMYMYCVNRFNCIVHSTAVCTSVALLSQLLLLNAVRDVAKSLGDLIDSTRVASGKSVSDPAMEQLKGSAKVGRLFL